MSNEQRAHDLTMLYVKLFTKFETPDENGTLKIDPYGKYKEIFPIMLETVNNDFPQ